MLTVRNLARVAEPRHLPGMTDTLLGFVRRHDPDRFFTVLFAPAKRRDALLALYAFNHELARAREAVREPGLALIRLQWWREVIEGMEKRHEVATPLSACLNRGALDRGDLLALIEAREVEADPAIEDIVMWRSYVLGTAGGLAVAAGRALGAAEPETLRPLGGAFGVAGLLRSVTVLAQHARCLLPEDVLSAAGLSGDAVILQPDTPAIADVRRVLIGEGREMLKAGRVPDGAIAAGLPAVLARRDLDRLDVGGPLPAKARGIGDKLAVLLAALSGRV